MTSYTSDVAAIAADILAALEAGPATANQIEASVGRKMKAPAGVSAWHYCTRRGLIKYHGPDDTRKQVPLFALTSRGDAALAAYRGSR